MTDLSREIAHLQMPQKPAVAQQNATPLSRGLLDLRARNVRFGS